MTTDAQHPSADTIIEQAAILLDYLNRWRGITIVVGTKHTWINDDRASGVDSILAQGNSLIKATLDLHIRFPNGRKEDPNA